jgi:hypothetical protein
LWQLAQLFVMPVWSKRAGVQARGEWQLSQALSLGMWPAGLPVAWAPSWQEKHAPLTCAWSTRVTGFHASVAWQVPQAVLEEM